MSTLSRLEIQIKTFGTIVLLLGTSAVSYTVILFLRTLLESKYVMVAVFSIGISLLHVGYGSFRFSQRITGHMIYEHGILQ